MGFFQGFPGDPLRTIDRFSRFEFADVSTSVPVGTTIAAQVGTMTSLRSLKLPKASSAVAGTRLLIIDESNTITSTKTLTIQMAPVSGDTFGNSTMTSYTLTKAGAWLEVETDGKNKWSITDIDYQSPTDLWAPGLRGCTVPDLTTCGTSSAVTAANQFFAKVPVPRPTVFTNAVLQVAVAGVTIANCFVAWYDSSGTMITQSADQAANWTSTGVKTIALSVTPVWTGPTTFGWIMVYVGSATTGVQMSGTVASAVAGAYAFGDGASSLRAGTIALASTATMPNITPSSIVTTNRLYGIGLT